jgi:hypothetical protein
MVVRVDIVLLDSMITTDYGQFEIVWSDEFFEGDFDRCFDGQVNGIVGAARPSLIYFNLARHGDGTSPVRIVLLDAEPPEPEPQWEDVVEVSTTLPPEGEVRWLSWGAESSGVLRGLGAGDYRVRVSASGRGDADDYPQDDLDRYLIEWWPAPRKPDEIIRLGSENAKYWHKEVGSRR